MKRREQNVLTTVIKPIKVVATTCKKQAFQVASGERGELITFAGIVNDDPTCLRMSKVTNLEEFMSGAPVASLTLGNKSGWMTVELFSHVLVHVINHTHCTNIDPIFFLVDKNELHASLNGVKYCKDNGIIL
ncbi:inactive peptidyl-prolyl cis-trans isomerase fkbp6 [Holotrichia oblita]|uniref:Inactive peptidyl-prolyl cis-trans isomerase fkbp6 n=1 Tax=Holotrichia oblita TaxID=644536 RepID=A0ACB9TT56_HOLOL|nr:inactive peptidyl-prolyl cis-trans isomerase fkbp6 [Holotrichia oblita]